ncbi:MAG: hypothetical protein GY938_14110 [Ketobacter sp.]|nr:hypothetical protein [Ketobacter sp.]
MKIIGIRAHSKALQPVLFFNTACLSINETIGPVQCWLLHAVIKLYRAIWAIQTILKKAYDPGLYLAELIRYAQIATCHGVAAIFR